MKSIKEFILKQKLFVLIGVYTALLAMTGPFPKDPAIAVGFLFLNALFIICNYFSAKALRKGAKSPARKTGLVLLTLFTSGFYSLLVIPMAMYDGRKKMDQELVILKGSLV